MKEYTVLAVIAALAAIVLDAALRTHLYRRRTFWVFWIVMAMLMTVMNGYLTWRPIVRYGEQFFLGLRLGTIPVEDYLFGFALITMNLVVWEVVTGRAARGTTGESGS